MSEAPTLTALSASDLELVNMLERAHNEALATPALSASDLELVNMLERAHNRKGN